MDWDCRAILTGGIMTMISLIGFVFNYGLIILSRRYIQTLKVMKVTNLGDGQNAVPVMRLCSRDKVTLILSNFMSVFSAYRNTINIILNEQQFSVCCNIHNISIVCVFTGG